MKPIRTRTKALFFGVVVGTLVFALHTAALAGEVVMVAGTGTGLGAMKQLGAAFEKAHPGVRVRVMPSLGSSGSIKALSQGALDIAISARPLKETEQAGGMTAAEYARSPYIFIAHGKVGAHGLTVGQLEKIYAGAMQTWPDGKRIRLVLRPETDIDTQIISAVSPAMEQAMRAALARKGMICAVTDQECVEAVVRTPGALGGSTLTQIITEKQPVKVLALDGVVPSVRALANGRYRLFKALYIVMPQRASTAARQFADFVRSREGGRILARTGNLVIPLGGR